MQLDATAFFNRYDDLIISVGRTFTRLEPLPHRQHLQRAGAGRRVRRSPWRANAGARCARRATPSSTARSSRSTASSSGADAVRRRRSAAAPAAPLRASSMHRGRARQCAARSRRCMMRGETLDAEPAFGPSAASTTNAGYTVFNLGGSWRPVQAGRGLRARREPVRSRLRRSARLPGAGPHGLRGSPRCCGPITSRFAYAAGAPLVVDGVTRPPRRRCARRHARPERIRQDHAAAAAERHRAARPSGRVLARRSAARATVAAGRWRGTLRSCRRRPSSPSSIARSRSC